MKNNSKIDDYIITSSSFIVGGLGLQKGITEIMSKGFTLDSSIFLLGGIALLFIGFFYIKDIRRNVSKALSRKRKMAVKVDEYRDYKRVVEALPTKTEDVDLFVQNDGEEVEMKVKKQ